MKPRKTFLHRSFIFLLVLVLLLGASSGLLAEVVPTHITLTWAGAPERTQTITWRTDFTTVAGQVQYREAIEGGTFLSKDRTIQGEVEEMSTPGRNLSIHSVTLSNLKPGTRYVYRVGNEACWSEPRTFVTAPTNASSFKFLVFGDSQSISYDTWRITLEQAYQANPDAVFLTNVGDLVDVGQDYGEWDAWFDAAQGVVDTIPVMPVTGNHEAYTPDGKFSLPVFFTAQLKLPRNGPADLKGQVYSFDYGDVHFCMLDSQESEEESFIPAMLDRQKAWLEKDLEATDKKWKMAVIHRPPYNNKVTGDNDHIRAAFVPFLDKYHVDVVFTGHDHVYARTYPLSGGAVVDSPAKGTIYVATGRSGSKTYSDVLAKDWNAFFCNPQDEPNYLTVEVAKDSLQVKAFKQSGELIDAWSIDK